MFGEPLRGGLPMHQFRGPLSDNDLGSGLIRNRSGGFPITRLVVLGQAADEDEDLPGRTEGGY